MEEFFDYANPIEKKKKQNVFEFQNKIFKMQAVPFHLIHTSATSVCKFPCATINPINKIIVSLQTFKTEEREEIFFA